MPGALEGIRVVDLTTIFTGPMATTMLADQGAEVVKVDVARVPGAVQAFGVRSTPTFVLLGRSAKVSKKKRAKAAPAPKAAMSPRWRASGLVQKDQLAKVLESNGAQRASGPQ